MLQFVLFIMSVNGVLNKWDFSAFLFVLAFSLFGGIGAGLGIGLAIKNKKNMRAEWADGLLLYFLCILLTASVEFVYGWNNIDLSAANDYSTDPITPPQFNKSKHERLLIKESAEWLGLMDIPHKVRKSETESVILFMSGLDSKILIKQTLNNLGWVFLRRSHDASNDKVFNETYIAKAGITGIYRRTDLAVRVISDNKGTSIVDARASSAYRHRDLEFITLWLKSWLKS